VEGIVHDIHSLTLGVYFVVPIVTGTIWTNRKVSDVQSCPNTQPGIDQHPRNLPNRTFFTYLTTLGKAQVQYDAMTMAKLCHYGCILIPAQCLVL